MKTYNNKFTIALLFGFLFFLNAFINAQSVPEKIKEYIQKNKEQAIEQMILFRIPASVTMAQAIKESGYGTSSLAKESNNHFGIKCHKEWGGDSFIKDDDSLNECFRKYNKAEDSFYDHSMFLKSRPRYDFLFSMSITDYSSWCVGLKKAGYATAPDYTDQLLYFIKTYNLQELDQIIPLKNSLKPEELLACEEKNIILNQENYFATAEKHNLAKVIFNIYEPEEEALLVRRNTSDNNAD